MRVVGCIILFGVMLLGFKATRFIISAVQNLARYPHVISQNIHIAEQPADCDFLTAPIGVKPCDYEKVETFIDRNGLRVADETAGGKVFVTWKKVEEQ